MVYVYYENVSGVFVPKTYPPLMKRVIRKIIKVEYPNHKFEVNLTVCDNKYIKDINKEHRGIDTPTDVLSFPFYDFNTPDIITMLGDIVISIEKAKEQAELYGHSLKRELCFLAAHSALHLIGYDHQNISDRERMEEKQQSILENLGITR